MLSNIDNATTDYTERIKSLGTCKHGTGHDNFLNGIIVQFDLTLSNKCWVEMQRYHFIDFVSSQSTMHRITSFDLTTSYNEYVDKRIIDIMTDKVAWYNSFKQTIEADNSLKAKLENDLERLYELNETDRGEGGFGSTGVSKDPTPEYEQLSLFDASM